MKIKLTAIILCIALSLLFTSCAPSNNSTDKSQAESGNDNSATNYSGDSSSVSENDSEIIDRYSLDFTARELDDSYSPANSTRIEFGENGIKITGTGASSNGNILSINRDGTYIITGSCSDGRIVVNADETAKPQIVLDGLTLTSKSGPAIYIKSADKVFITLAKDTVNTLSDAKSYTDNNVDNADGAVFSKSDLAINGSGSLFVNGNYKHGIVSKDDLIITNGTITVVSAKTAIDGKDSVKIGGGTVNVTAGTNGIRSENDTKEGKGYVYIAGGKLNITSETDGIKAVTLINIIECELTVKTGGGSANASYSSGGFVPGWGITNGTDTSAKALKCSGNIVISGGDIDIDSSDDSIHSNSNIEINGGKLKISSGDDGIHADTKLVINSGEVSILKSYEGLESTDITINGGIITLKSSDDGINAAGGNDSSSINGRPGMGSFSGGSGTLTINGGYIYVDADGDGLDSNGKLTVTGGVILVCGPTSNNNGALDYDSDASISGGIVIALGSSGMAQNFRTADGQGSMLVSVSSQKAGTTVALCDDSGRVLLSLKSTKAFNSILFSSPSVKQGESYSVVVGADIADTDENGFAENTAKTGGSVLTTVNMTSTIVGSGGMGGFGDMGGGKPQKPGRW